MTLAITRCPENPIVWPGKWAWRMSNAYNPGALYENGCCDTSIGLATVPLDELVDAIFATS